MLAGASLRDNARLAHASRKQSLAKTVVDLVGAGVIQVFAFQIDLRATPGFRQPFSKVQWRRPAGVGPQKFIEFGLKPGVALRLEVRGLELLQRMHERLGHELPAVISEMTFHDLPY